MSTDFYIAFLSGWFVLLIFWSLIVIFILLRKPPNSKLTKKTFVISYSIFGLLLLAIFFFKQHDSFF